MAGALLCCIVCRVFAASCTIHCSVACTAIPFTASLHSCVDRVGAQADMGGMLLMQDAATPNAQLHGQGNGLHDYLGLMACAFAGSSSNNNNQNNNGGEIERCTSFSRQPDTFLECIWC